MKAACLGPRGARPSALWVQGADGPLPVNPQLLGPVRLQRQKKKKQKTELFAVIFFPVTFQLLQATPRASGGQGQRPGSPWSKGEGDEPRKRASLLFCFVLFLAEPCSQVSAR